MENTNQKYWEEPKDNIMLSWAVNNSTHLIAGSLASEKIQPTDEELKGLVKEWTEWYIAYFQERKAETIKKRQKHG